MRSIRNLAISLIVILCLAHSTFAATYYMRADGTATNKAAATGPASDPSKCMNVATHNSQTYSSGDVLLISSQGGVYTYSIIPPSSGGADYIYYKNVEGETPVFNLQNIIAGAWTSESGGIYSKGAMSTPVNHFWEDGIPLMRASNESLSDGNWHWKDATDTIYYRPSYGVPIDHTLGWINTTITLKGCIHVINKSKIMITNNTLGNIRFETSNQGVYVRATGDINDIVVDNVLFYYCHDGILLLTDDTFKTIGAITNNCFYYCMSAIRLYGYNDKGGVHTFAINNNYGCGTGSIDGSISYGEGDREFIGIQNPDSCVISNNTSVNGRNIFIFLYACANQDTKNNLIYNNFCYNNKMAFFRIAGTSPWTWNNNKFYNNIGATIATGGNGDDSWALYFAQPSIKPNNMNYIYNNVVDGGAIGIILYGIGSGYPYYLTIKNNIFSNQTLSSVFLCYADMSEYYLDYNCYENVNFYYPESYRDLNTWRSLTGKDAHSLIANPLFFNERGSNPMDYRLNSGSPCIKAGTNVGLTRDYQGNGWRSPPSMGAIEYYNIGGVISPGTVSGSNYKPK